MFGTNVAKILLFVFLSDLGKPGVRSLGSDVTESATCWDLTDVTLADEDTNSIPTDNANRAIQGNVAMHWCNLVANFRQTDNANRAIQGNVVMQVT